MNESLQKIFFATAFCFVLVKTDISAFANEGSGVSTTQPFTKTVTLSKESVGKKTLTDYVVSKKEAENRHLNKMKTTANSSGKIPIKRVLYKSHENLTSIYISAPANDETAECDGAGNIAEFNAWLANNGGAAVADDCGNVVWDNDFTAFNFTCGNTGNVTVTFTATDDCNNTASTSATFTIEDTTPPDIQTPASDLLLECDLLNNPNEVNDWLNNNGGASAIDACGSVTWQYDLGSFNATCGIAGSVLVTFTATDECGNTATTSATITVSDTTPPDIQTPASDLLLECDILNNTNEVNDWLNNNGGAFATDACSSVTWQYDAGSFNSTCGLIGSVLITFTATDDCGNTATTSATITVTDTTPPDIQTPASDLLLECDILNNSNDINDWLNNNGGASASDACGSVTWQYDLGSFNTTCGFVGNILVTFTATDACGNTATTSATATITDTTPPDMQTGAADLAVECDGLGNITDLTDWLNNNGGASSNDACGGVVWNNDYDGSNFNFVCGNTGSITVTFTATDECNNTASTAAKFTITDTTPPNIINAASDLFLSCSVTT